MKNKVVAGLLAIFLGGFGAHKFYLGKPMWGIGYLVLCWTYIPAIVALFEGIMYFFMSDTEFNNQYNGDNDNESGTSIPRKSSLHDAVSGKNNV